jgi:tetratricopeptide (TPR) repeat protein
MGSDERFRKLNELAWEHIRAKDFARAEQVLRGLLEETSGEATEPDRRWYLIGLLADVLGSLERFDESVDMRRRALSAARACRYPESAQRASQYMLAHYLLWHGAFLEACCEAAPLPAGKGHVQSLLHSVVAQGLWKLSRYEESAKAARRAIESCPTSDRRVELSRELGHILNAG